MAQKIAREEKVLQNRYVQALSSSVGFVTDSIRYGKVLLNAAKYNL